MPRAIAMPTTKTAVIAMMGGLDQISPRLLGRPGSCKDMRNFECVEEDGGGYRRIHGFDQTDGRPLASTATVTFVRAYVPIQARGASLLAKAPNADVTQGATTGKLVAVERVADDRYLLAVHSLSASLNEQDNMIVGGTHIGVPILSVILPPAKHLSLTVKGQNLIRADRAGVPGSGPLRGAFQFGATRFALRDTDDGTAQRLYKSSVNGWVEVPLFREIGFTAGHEALPPDGATLTQGGVTATLKRAVTEYGVWGATEEANRPGGRLIVTDPQGGAFSQGAATLAVAGGDVTVTLADAGSPITLAPGGQWEWKPGNFKGQAATIRLYGVDGRNRIHEFDGETLVPINSALNADSPTMIEIFQNHLWYAKDSSVFCSGINDPYRHRHGDGAAEYPMGKTVTGLEPQVGDERAAAMVVGTTGSTQILYGTSARVFQPRLFQNEVGALPRTMYQMDRVYFLNQLGLYKMSTAFQFGHFRQASLSNYVKRYLDAHLFGVVNACVHKGKNQYRLFFDDGTALYATIVNGKLLGYGVQEFPRRFSVVWNGLDGSGNEVTLAGDAENGQVYQLDVGGSFNGQRIAAYVDLWDDTDGAPRLHKTYRRAALYLTGESYIQGEIAYSLAFERDSHTQPTEAEPIETDLAAKPYWGTETMVWDRFTWDGKDIEPLEFDLDGEAEAIGFRFRFDSDFLLPFTLQTLTYDYTPRRVIRGS